MTLRLIVKVDYFLRIHTSCFMVWLARQLRVRVRGTARVRARVRVKPRHRIRTGVRPECTNPMQLSSTLQHPDKSYAD